MRTRQIFIQQFRQTEARIRALQAQWKRMSALTEPELDQLLGATMRELYPCPCASKQAGGHCHNDQEPVRSLNNVQDRQSRKHPNPEAGLPFGLSRVRLPGSQATRATASPGKAIKA